MAGVPVSGPGKYSKRTDLPKTPGLGGGDKGTSDLQYGDVKRLESGPPTKRPQGGTSARPPGGARRAPGSTMSKGGLPDFLFSTPTGRPDEPVTAGLTRGAGPGPEALMTAPAPPDLRTAALTFLEQIFGNQDVRVLRQQMATEQGMLAQTAPPVVPPPAAAQAPPTEGF